MNFVEVEATLNDIERDTAQDLNSAMERVFSSVSSQVRKGKRAGFNMDMRRVSQGLLRARNRLVLQGMADSVGEINRQLRVQGEAPLTRTAQFIDARDLARASGIDLEATQARLAKVMEVSPGELDSFAKGQLKEARDQAAQLAKEVEKDLRKQLGKLPKNAKPKEIRAAVGKAKARWVAAKKELSAGAGAVFNTAENAAYNEGRLRTYRRLAPMYVQGLVYSAILDNRTTEFCRVHDGVQRPIDDPIWNTIVPPNHFQCRSIIGAVMMGEGLDGLKEPLPETPPAKGFKGVGFNPLKQSVRFTPSKLPVALRAPGLGGVAGGAAAAEAAWAEVQYAKWMDPFDGGGVKKNVANSSALTRDLKEVHSKALLGDPDACYQLGYYYENGVYCKRNANRASAWFRAAEERGHETARLAQARYHKKGSRWYLNDDAGHTPIPGKAPSLRGDVGLVKKPIKPKPISKPVTPKPELSIEALEKKVAEARAEFDRLAYAPEVSPEGLVEARKKLEAAKSELAKRQKTSITAKPKVVAKPTPKPVPVGDESWLAELRKVPGMEGTPDWDLIRQIRAKAADGTIHPDVVFRIRRSAIGLQWDQLKVGKELWTGSMQLQQNKELAIKLIKRSASKGNMASKQWLIDHDIATKPVIPKPLPKPKPKPIVSKPLPKPTRPRPDLPKRPPPRELPKGKKPTFIADPDDAIARAEQEMQGFWKWWEDNMPAGTPSREQAEEARKALIRHLGAQNDSLRRPDVAKKIADNFRRQRLGFKNHNLVDEWSDTLEEILRNINGDFLLGPGKTKLRSIKLSHTEVDELGRTVEITRPWASRGISTPEIAVGDRRYGNLRWRKTPYTGNQVGSFVHEFGHHMEYTSSKAHARWMKWRNSRAAEHAGKKTASRKMLVKIKEKGDKTEWAWEGNFYDKYVGRSYDWGSYNQRSVKREMRVNSTECFSMGMQALADPGTLSRMVQKDKDHLRLLWATLRGY